MPKQTRKEAQETRAYQIAADLVMLPNKRIKNVDANNDGKIDGFQFDIANPFYTGEPVSAIRNLLINVDSEKISPDRISFVLRDQRIGIKHASTLYELLWGFGEVASLYIEKAGGLKKGSHEIDCTLYLRPSAGDYGVGDMVYPKKITMTVE